MGFILEKLPPAKEIETPEVLRQAALAHRYLAELKGLCSSIPNQTILINTLSLQEARKSSAIENIITTQDDLYKAGLFEDKAAGSPNAKEVQNYARSLRKGFAVIKEHHLLTSNHIVAIQEELEQNKAGFRRLPGTGLINQATGQTVYTPPQSLDQIQELMANLEKFINDDDFYAADVLVKMAIIHYQFESIHPFYDGNGRTGRIINVLYLVLKGLLDIPVLYLSRYIIDTKGQYYRLLQQVRDEDAWQDWVIYMLKAVEQTAIDTIKLVNGIRNVIDDYNQKIQMDFKFYSRDIINSLFFHPYTKIEFIERDLKVSRITATKYLNDLSEAGLLQKRKLGRSYYYVNVGLYNILTAGEN